MRESVAVVCHGQGAIAVSDKSRTPRLQEISSLKQLFSYPEWLLVCVGLGLGLLKEKQKSELRVSRRYIEVEREIALDLVSRRSV